MKWTQSMLDGKQPHIILGPTTRYFKDRYEDLWDENKLFESEKKNFKNPVTSKGSQHKGNGEKSLVGKRETCRPTVQIRT